MNQNKFIFTQTALYISQQADVTLSTVDVLMCYAITKETFPDSFLYLLVNNSLIHTSLHKNNSQCCRQQLPVSKLYIVKNGSTIHMQKR